MCLSFSFQGVSPKLEFSTRTVIEEVPNFIPDTSQVDNSFSNTCWQLIVLRLLNCFVIGLAYACVRIEYVCFLNADDWHS